MGINMEVWVAAIFAVVFSAGGAISLCMGIKTGKRFLKITGMALLLACAMCVLYIVATWLLLSGIK